MPKRYPSKLYVSIDELTIPRDWRALGLCFGQQDSVQRSDVNLVALNVEQVEALISRHWQEIQSSGFQRIAYRNVSDCLQEKIKQKRRVDQRT